MPKHVGVIREDLCFSGLHVAFSSARAGVCNSVLVMKVHGCELIKWMFESVLWV
jgi:hypothetical protein